MDHNYTTKATDDTCAVCCGVFLRKKRGFLRTNIDGPLEKHHTSVRAVLNSVGIDTAAMTGFLCHECVSPIRVMATSMEKLAFSKDNFISKISQSSELHPIVNVTASFQTPVQGKRKIDKVIPPSTTPKRKKKKPGVSFTTPRKGALFSKKQNTPLSRDKHKKTPSHTPLRRSTPTRRSNARKQTAFRMKQGKMCQQILKGNWYSLLQTMYDDPYLRKCLTSFIDKTSRKEITNLSQSQNNSVLRCDQPSVANIEKLNWDDLVTESKQYCPVLQSALVGSITSSKKQSETMTKGNGKMKKSLKPIFGSVMAVIAFTRKPKSMKALQVMNSVQLWRAGAKRKVFNRFNKLSFCMSSWSSRTCIDLIRKDFDAKALDWKKDIVQQVPLSTTQPTRRNLTFEDDLGWITESVVELGRDGVGNVIQDVSCKSIAICMDNVNKKLHARHHTSARGDRMINQVHAYVVQDRIPTAHLSESMPTGDAIKNIPVSSYLPSEEDHAQLRDEFEMHVQRVLVSDMAMFQDLSDCVVWHEAHEYTVESCLQSDYVPIGVLDYDEAKTSEMIQIMVAHQKYVPLYDSGKAHRVLYWGDGLSAERGNDAIEARANGRDDFDKLTTYEVAIADWHPRGYAYQDTMDELFEPLSSRSPGTYSHIKNVYRHTAVTPNNVLHSFDKTAEFEEFCADSYILAFSCHILGVGSIRKKSNKCPEERLDLLLKTAHDIVDLVFDPPCSQSVIDAVVTGIDEYPYCLCRVDAGGEMICCDNKNCPRGQWFHLDCINMSAEDVPDDSWYCHNFCEKMIRSGGGKKGKKNKRKSKSKQSTDSDSGPPHVIDRKYAYSKAVVWRGLMNKCLHDAIRHNNGPKIIRSWKYRMFDLETYHHPKLLVQCIKLLTGVNGGLSERLQHQLVWCRTINFLGGLGKNIPTDLFMEHLNKAYKESIQSAGGNLTAETIDRHSQMLAVQPIIDKLYDTFVTESDKVSGQHTSMADRSADKSSLVKTLLDDHLVEDIGDRCHSGLEQFVYNNNTCNQARLKKAILRHRERLAKKRDRHGH